MEKDLEVAENTEVVEEVIPQYNKEARMAAMTTSLINMAVSVAGPGVVSLLMDDKVPSMPEVKNPRSEESKRAIEKAQAKRDRKAARRVALGKLNET